MQKALQFPILGTCRPDKNGWTHSAMLDVLKPKTLGTILELLDGKAE